MKIKKQTEGYKTNIKTVNAFNTDKINFLKEKYSIRIYVMIEYF